MAIYRFKIPAKALCGMIDRFTHGQDWWALERENPEKYKLWMKIYNTTELTEQEHKLFIEDLTSGIWFMEDWVRENDEYPESKQRVSEYKAGIKWIRNYLNQYNAK
jgi:hypothetical protein